MSVLSVQTPPTLFNNFPKPCQITSKPATVTPKRIAIVGGGMAGAVAALRLCQSAQNDAHSAPIKVTLYETNEHLVDGPPFCHLHAGGCLYREISDEQCEVL